MYAAGFILRKECNGIEERSSQYWCIVDLHSIYRIQTDPLYLPPRDEGLKYKNEADHPPLTPKKAMNRYALTKKLGDGTYGSVLKAVNRQTGEEVAVKKMKKTFTT